MVTVSVSDGIAVDYRTFEWTIEDSDWLAGNLVAENWEGEHVNLELPDVDPAGNAIQYISAEGLPIGVSFDAISGTFTGGISYANADGQTPLRDYSVTVTYSIVESSEPTTSSFPWRIHDVNRIALIADQSNAEGDYVEIYLEPLRDALGNTLRYEATGMPEGLSIEYYLAGESRLGEGAFLVGKIAYRNVASNDGPMEFIVTIVTRDSTPLESWDQHNFVWSVRDTNRIVPIFPRWDNEGARAEQWIDLNIDSLSTYTISVSNLPSGLFFDAAIRKVSGYVSFDAVNPPDSVRTYITVVTLETDDGTDYCQFAWTITNVSYDELPNDENGDGARVVLLEVWEGERIYMGLPNDMEGTYWQMLTGELPPDLQVSGSNTIAGQIGYDAVPDYLANSRFLCTFQNAHLGLLQLVIIVYNVSQQSRPKVVVTDLRIRFSMDAFIPEWYDRAPIGWWAAFSPLNYEGAKVLYNAWRKMGLGTPDKAGPPPPRTDGAGLFGYEYIVGLGDGRSFASRAPALNEDDTKEGAISFKALGTVKIPIKVEIAVDAQGTRRIQRLYVGDDVLRSGLEHDVAVGRSVISFDWAGIRGSPVWNEWAPDTYTEFKSYFKKYALTDTLGVRGDRETSEEKRDSNYPELPSVLPVTLAGNVLTLASPVHYWVRTPLYRRIAEYIERTRLGIRPPAIPKIDWRIQELRLSVTADRKSLDFTITLSHDAYPNWEAFVTLESTFIPPHGPRVDNVGIYQYDHNNPRRHDITALRGDGTEIKKTISQSLDIFKVVVIE